MRIIISDNYVITDDNGLSYALCKVVPTSPKEKEKSGNDTKDVAISWHASVDQAVKAYMRIKVKEEIKGDMTLAEFMKKKIKLEREIASKLTGELNA